MTHVNNGDINANADEISLKDLFQKSAEVWRYLLSKWLLILCGGLLGGVLGLTYAYLKKTVYIAELSFALEEDKPAAGNFAGIASQFGIDLSSSGGGAFSGDNLVAFMKSRLIVEKSLLSSITFNGKKQTLVDLYIRFNKFDEQWKKDPKLKYINFPINADRSKFTLKQDSILGAFFNSIVKTDLVVDKADKKSNILSIKVTSQNEAFSKNFTESLAKTVSDFYVDTKTKKSVQNVNILQRQTDSVRYELNRAINGVASSVDINPNANPALQILRAPSQRRQVDVQANTAILNQLVANLELAKVTLRKETPLIQIIDKPILPLPKERLGKIKGVILGGVLFGFLTTLYLVLAYAIKKLIK